MDSIQEETKIKQLKEMLKEYGINNAKELDEELSKAIKSINIGIMTDCIVEENQWIFNCEKCGKVQRMKCMARWNSGKNYTAQILAWKFK